MSHFLHNRSQQEIVKLQKYMSSDMDFLCKVAMLPKDIQKCLSRLLVKIGSVRTQNFSNICIRNFCLNEMFDGNQKAIKVFEQLEADEALQLYEELKSVKKSGQSIIRLFWAYQKDKEKVLNMLKSWSFGCCSYLIITENDEIQLQVLLQEYKILKQHFLNKKVFVYWDTKGSNYCCIRAYSISLSCIIPAALGGGLGAFSGTVCCGTIWPVAGSLCAVGCCGGCGAWSWLEYRKMREAIL